MTREDTTSISVARGVVDHPYRRLLLALLDSEEPPVPVVDLARAVSACDPTASDVAAAVAPALDGSAEQPASVVDTLAAQLHHSHLPRMAAAGLLEYDTGSAAVTDWRHPPVGDRWLTSPPVDRLATVIADARKPTARPSD
jgi:hypothetical protein